MTPENIYFSRRKFISQLANLSLIGTTAFSASAKGQIELTATEEKRVTSYNNYYEFSNNKEAVKHLAKSFTMEPWSLSISGLVENPYSLSVEDLPSTQEYIRRLRCVEGWSIIVPWLGFPLAKLIGKARPLNTAKFVKFTTVLRPAEMIGQRRSNFSWPYVEGLRLDEAMHPLTILATGMYKKKLPAQNGGPVRLVVPWKYGFKSIKAIEKIELVDEQPQTSWNLKSPSEYGFYANVNPAVAHPRWSQRREVPLGQLRKIPTLPFNGYEKEVAYLYKGMDLEKHY